MKWFKFPVVYVTRECPDRRGLNDPKAPNIHMAHFTWQGQNLEQWLQKYTQNVYDATSSWAIAPVHWEHFLFELDLTRSISCRHMSLWSSCTLLPAIIQHPSWRTLSCWHGLLSIPVAFHSPWAGINCLHTTALYIAMWAQEQQGITCPLSHHVFFLSFHHLICPVTVTLASADSL